MEQSQWLEKQKFFSFSAEQTEGLWISGLVSPLGKRYVALLTKKRENV
jgi:hypothetical protein